MSKLRTLETLQFDNTFARLPEVFYAKVTPTPLKNPCLVGSEVEVLREQVETGATLLRLAPSHVRFGHFEFFYWRRQFDHLKTLADYVLAQHFPELVGRPDAYARFYHEAAVRTARLIAKWQAVGFAHGVMNSDNMSVLGMTLDYGPFGFLEAYNPAFICNHSDHQGRYAFHNQPDIGYFNLRCLAQALTPLAPDEAIKAGLDAYEAVFAEHYGELMRAKLGLREALPGDDPLLRGLLELMRESGADYTNVFRAFCDFKQAPEARNETIRGYFVDREAFDKWAERYKARPWAEGSRDEGRREAERAARMRRVNPKYVLRNYLAHTAIQMATEQKDFSEIERLRLLLRDPFAEQPELDRYAAPPPAWGKHLIGSCSS